MSFTLESYTELLNNLIEFFDGPFLTVRDASKELGDIGKINKYIILRHDVDRRANRSVQLAQLEASYNISSTYYFRTSRNGSFPYLEIEKIRDLGHEIGYHYECLSRASGDHDKAMEFFERDLECLRKIAPCNTVAMHGAPLSRFDNRKLLNISHLLKFDLSADAVISFSDENLSYFTDTGGRWNASSKINKRDYVGLSLGDYPCPDSADFTNWLSITNCPIYISTHPERWTDNYALFAEAKLRDFFANQAKKIFSRFLG